MLSKILLIAPLVYSFVLPIVLLSRNQSECNSLMDINGYQNYLIISILNSLLEILLFIRLSYWLSDDDTQKLEKPAYAPVIYLSGCIILILNLVLLIYGIPQTPGSTCVTSPLLISLWSINILTFICIICGIFVIKFVLSPLFSASPV